MLKRSILLGVAAALIGLSRGEAEAKGPFDPVGSAAQRLAVQKRLRPGTRGMAARKVPLRRRVATTNPGRTVKRVVASKTSARWLPVIKCSDDGRLCMACYYDNGVLIYCDVYHLPALQQAAVMRR